MEKQEEKILTKLQEDFKQEIEKYENKRKVDQIGKNNKKTKAKKRKMESMKKMIKRRT